MSLISKPLFRSNNTEALEVADIYDVSDNRPVNKVYDSLKKGSEKLWHSAGGTQGVLSGIERVYDAKDKGLSGLELLNSGLGVFNTSTANILKNATLDIASKAGDFIGLDPSVVDKIKRVGEGIVRNVDYGRGGDIKTYGALTDLIGDLSGNRKVAEMIHLGYVSAVWGAAFAESNRYGESTYRRVQESVDPEVFRRGVIYSIPSVAATGRIEAVTELLEVIDADTVLGYHSDFVTRFLSAYRIPNPRPADMVAHANDVVSTLERVKSKWYYYTLDSGREVYDLTCFNNMSYDAYEVMCLNDTVSKAAQISKGYGTRSILDLIYKQFPRMVKLT